MYIGITAEWNPFHSGHAHMLRSLKNLFPDAPIISAMSGSFVQRGEPAIFDKWTRAKWALMFGVDAVIELLYFVYCKAPTNLLPHRFHCFTIWGVPILLLALNP